MTLVCEPATPDRLEELVAVDIAAWGQEMAATRDMLATRMEVNPHGNFLAVHMESGRIVGSVWTLCIPDRSFPSWMEATGEGVYRGVHDPSHPVVFGANISAVRDFVAEPVGPALLRHVVEEAIWKARKPFGRLGSRMPGYAKWSKLFRAEDYIHLHRSADRVFLLDGTGRFRDGGTLARLLDLRKAGSGHVDPTQWPLLAQAPRDPQPFDHELTFFTTVDVHRQAFRVVRLLPGYFPDPDSLDNGVLLEWRNPDL